MPKNDITNRDQKFSELYVYCSIRINGSKFKHEYKIEPEAVLDRDTYMIMAKRLFDVVKKAIHQ